MTITNGRPTMNVVQHNSWQINIDGNKTKFIHVNTTFTWSWYISLMCNAIRNVSETNTTGLKYLPTPSEHFLCTHIATSKAIFTVWLVTFTSNIPLYLMSTEKAFCYINLPQTDSKPIVHFKLQCKHWHSNRNDTTATWNQSADSKEYHHY
jgi:hypothetical protein